MAQGKQGGVNYSNLKYPFCRWKIVLASPTIRSMTEIILVDKPIRHTQLKEIATQGFGDLVKAVVDIEKEIMAVGGELHADEEAFLLDQGSKQPDIWGINIYPDVALPDGLEFDSMINIRPSQNNPSRVVQDPAIREKITEIVNKLIKE